MILQRVEPVSFLLFLCFLSIGQALLSHPTRVVTKPRNGLRPFCSTVRLAGAGDDGFSKTLDLMHKGAKFFQELDSKQVDPDEAEQAALEEEASEKEEKESRQKDSGDPGKDTTRTKTNTTSDIVPNEIEQAVQKKLDAFNRRARRTRIVLLKKIAAWAFEVSDVKQDGKIDRSAFYSGTLLVHLHLAKYVGVAACQPPSRNQIDELFELADANRNGWLDKEEFTNAVVVATAPISSRIAVYWSLLAILPFVVNRTMGGVTRLLESNIQNMPPSLFKKGLALLEFSIQLLLSRAFFSILLPNIFGKIDRAARQYAFKRSRKKSNTSLWWLRMPKPSKDNKPESWASWSSQVWESFVESQNNWFGVQNSTNQSSPKQMKKEQSHTTTDNKDQ